MFGTLAAEHFGGIIACREYGWRAGRNGDRWGLWGLWGLMERNRDNDITEGAWKAMGIVVPTSSGSRGTDKENDSGDVSLKSF